MPRFPAIALLFGAFLCTPSAGGQELGIGIIAGNPTGISVKKWLDGGNAVDAAAAWSFDDHGAFQLHADYLWHRPISPFSQCVEGCLPWYWGVGGRLQFNNGARRHGGDNRAGLRVPLGISYSLERAPVEIFGEVVPVLDVAPETDLELDAAIGFRYYFR